MLTQSLRKGWGRHCPAPYARQGGAKSDSASACAKTRPCTGKRKAGESIRNWECCLLKGLRAARRRGRGAAWRGGATRLPLGSRAAGSRTLSGVIEMGTSLDIKIKRANKVYHAGVSRVGWPTGSVVCRAPHTSGCPWAGQIRQVRPARCAPRAARALRGTPGGVPATSSGVRAEGPAP